MDIPATDWDDLASAEVVEDRIGSEWQPCYDFSDDEPTVADEWEPDYEDLLAQRAHADRPLFSDSPYWEGR